MTDDARITIENVEMSKADMLASQAIIAQSQALSLIRFIESKTGPGKTALATSPMKNLKEGLVQIYSTLGGALVAGGWLELTEEPVEEDADAVRPDP